jgi:hypothetical protein
VINGLIAVSRAAQKNGFSGRKNVLTSSMVEHVVMQDQLASGTTLRTLRGILELDPVPGYQTQYRSQVIHTPSISTLAKLKKSKDVMIKKLRLVPMITESNAKERLNWCETNVLQQPQTDEERIDFCKILESWVDVDETIITYSFGTGRILVLRRHNHQLELQDGELEGLSQDESLIVRDEMKSNPPSITCMEEGARFDPCRKGMVQVRRVRGEDVYTRRTKHKEVGDAKFSDITLKAKTFGYIMTNEGIVLISYLK